MRIRTRRVADVSALAAELRAAPLPAAARKDAAAAVEAVRQRGDAALRSYERRFNRNAPASTLVGADEIREARSRISRAELAAVREAARRLGAAEAAMLAALRARTTRSRGVTIRREFSPLRSVGCYVPGGSARYPSSAVMSVVPARAAGVPRIVVACPPHADGRIDPLTLVAADLCGATEIRCMGGAQAIAALSYGTESLEPVDKIVGPGGPHVAAAKLIVSERTPVDMLAGPTELVILADSSADPEHVIKDLISQAEHSEHSRCILATDSARLARAVAGMLPGAIAAAGRGRTAAASLAANGMIAVCGSLREAARLADRIAPEHLQVMARNPADAAARVTTAGLVLLGDTPSAASDYVLGSNHILPTSGHGSARGQLSVMDFVRLRTTVSATRAALARAMPHVAALASAEGLPGHADAVGARLR